MKPSNNPKRPPLDDLKEFLEACKRLWKVYFRLRELNKFRKLLDREVDKLLREEGRQNSPDEQVLRETQRIFGDHYQELVFQLQAWETLLLVRKRNRFEEWELRLLRTILRRRGL